MIKQKQSLILCHTFINIRAVIKRVQARLHPHHAGFASRIKLEPLPTIRSQRPINKVILTRGVAMEEKSYFKKSFSFRKLLAY